MRRSCASFFAHRKFRHFYFINKTILPNISIKVQHHTTLSFRPWSKLFFKPFARRVSHTLEDMRFDILTNCKSKSRRIDFSETMCDSLSNAQEKNSNSLTAFHSSENNSSQFIFTAFREQFCRVTMGVWQGYNAHLRLSTIQSATAYDAQRQYRRYPTTLYT